MGRALAEVAAAVPLRPAAAVLVVGAAALGAWRFAATGTERLIARGAFEEASRAIEARAAEKGEEDARVLYLRGRLAAARAEAGQGGGQRRAFGLYARAVAAGSGDALDVLEGAARSWECDRRRLAARALSDSGSRSALPALRALAEAEPPPADVVEGLKRILGAEGSCGVGDVARDGIRAIEGGGS
jgi:hypothetical protein